MKLPSAGQVPFKPPSEKEVQAILVRFFRAAGWIVGSTSQYRASRQLVGLPDLVMRHRGLRRFAWWETKAPLARWRFFPTDPWIYYTPGLARTWCSKPLQPKQAEFRDDSLACGELYGWGGLPEAEQFLIELCQGRRLSSGIFQLFQRFPAAKEVRSG